MAHSVKTASAEPGIAPRRPSSIQRRTALALASHWPEYLMEAGELGIFMVSACAFTALFEYPGSPIHQVLPDPMLRRFLIGLGMAGTALALIYSPWGKQSGAHMNPALTLTFLRLKKIDPLDALFYLAAQFIGGVSGVLAARAVLGGLLSHPAVNFAVTRPGKSGPGIAFLAEVIISFFLMLTVLIVSNYRKTAPFTGFFAAALIATYITFEAPFSGMSMNPARTVGSALSAHALGGLWIYFLAPPLGMMLAAELYLISYSKQGIYCAKLHHYNSKRCIFLCRFPELNRAETQVPMR